MMIWGLITALFSAGILLWGHNKALTGDLAKVIAYPSTFTLFGGILAFVFDVLYQGAELNPVLLFSLSGLITISATGFILYFIFKRDKTV